MATGLPDVGAADRVVPERIHDLGLADHARERQPAGDRLGDRHQVGLDPVVLDREHAPGAAEAGLHLVGDEQDSLAVADPRSPSMNSCGAGRKPASPCTGSTTIAATVSAATCVDERPLERAQRVGRGDPAVLVRERDAVDLGRERAEPGLVRVRLRGEREREERAAVEAALEADHGRAARVAARELDGVLDGLGARVEERGLGRARERRERDEALGVLDVDLVGDDREVGVEEARGLLLHRSDDARMRMADVEAADAAREVDEAVAVDVGDGRAAALGDHDRQVEAERVGDDPLLALDDLARAGAGNLGAKLDCACDCHEATISTPPDAEFR